LLKPGLKFSDSAGTVEEVDMGEALVEFVNVRADETAADDDGATRFAADTLEVTEGAGHFAFGALPDDAGIEKDEVSFLE